MRRRNAAFTVLVLLCLAGLFSGMAPVQAQTNSAGDYTFTQTGFTVPAAFYQYWQQNGGLPIFGYPISAAHQENGFTVQYFERNRFEYHPEISDTNFQVQLGLLGAVLTTGRTFDKAQSTVNDATHVYFADTDHSISGKFLDFWNANGAMRIFGYPISEEIQENGVTVQYFQRNRFEFHPNNPDGQQVMLGLLGRDYLDLQQRGQLPNNGATTQSNAPQAPATGATNTNAPAGFAPLTITPNKGPHVGYGVIVHMYFQDHDRILKLVQDMGFNWVKQQVVWADTEPSKGAYNWYELDHIVDSVHRYNMNLLLSVVGSPDWATSNKGLPDDPNNFKSFMQAISARYNGRVQAYELWNEENLANESGPDYKNPDKYAQVLEAGFLGVRASDASATVLMGAMAPTGVFTKDGYEDTWWIDQLYKWHNGELRNFFDGVASHPYGYWNPPDTMFPVKKPSDQTPAAEYKNNGQFFFRRVEDQRAIVEQYGDNAKQMWVTEFGWCSDQREGGYVECAGNSLDQQAQYLVRAYQMAKENYPWMGVMFVWNLNFSTFQEWYTGPSHFSLINGDWSPRPAYFALKNMPKN